jgi:hypothetical protein
MYFSVELHGLTLNEMSPPMIAPIHPTRRAALLGLGGTLLLLRGRMIAAQVADPLAPWQAAPAARHPDWRVRAAGWAVLAPNPHNRQPWLLDLVGADEALLRCDLDRRLPATDPFDRQITIGLGAFAELFRMAAAAEGIALATETFPEDEAQPRLDARPIARLRRIAGVAAPDPLFAHALARRSTKLPFDPARRPSAAQLALLHDAAGDASGFGATADADRVAALRALTWAAWETELTTSSAHLETVNLMRLGREAVAAQPDGVSVWGPGLDPLIAQGVITREGFATPGHPAYQAMVDRYRPMLAATPAFLWLASAADTRQAAFAAGRHWLRLNLAATAAGLALHPVSQALQEFPEMAPHVAEAHRLLLGDGAAAKVQMLGRVGFLPEGARAAPPTPRWAAETRIRAT